MEASRAPPTVRNGRPFAVLNVLILVGLFDTLYESSLWLDVYRIH
jgi:hypothetical protein